MTFQDEFEETLATLAALLDAQGMGDLAWNRRAWICSEGHRLRGYRRLRKGAPCPDPVDGRRCGGRVTHPPLSWFDVEDVLWAVARRRQWTVVQTVYHVGAEYQWTVVLNVYRGGRVWDVGATYQARSASTTDAALTALVAALRDEAAQDG